MRRTPPQNGLPGPPVAGASHTPIPGSVAGRPVLAALRMEPQRPPAFYTLPFSLKRDLSPPPLLLSRPPVPGRSVPLLTVPPSPGFLRLFILGFARSPRPVPRVVPGRGAGVLVFSGCASLAALAFPLLSARAPPRRSSGAKVAPLARRGRRSVSCRFPCPLLGPGGAVCAAL